jgi:hypothetical protein
MYISITRQIEIHKAEPLVPHPTPLEVETDIAKLKYKSPGSVHFLAELIQAGGETLWSENHKLINSICNKEELPDQCKESITVQMYKKGNENDCIVGYCCYQLHIKFFPLSFSQG